MIIERELYNNTRHLAQWLASARKRKGFGLDPGSIPGDGQFPPFYKPRDSFKVRSLIPVLFKMRVNSSSILWWAWLPILMDRSVLYLIAPILISSAYSYWDWVWPFLHLPSWDQFPHPIHRSYLFALLFIALLEIPQNGGLCSSWRHFFLTSLLKRKILSLSSGGNPGFANCKQQRKLKSNECIPVL